MRRIPILVLLAVCLATVAAFANAPGGLWDNLKFGWRASNDELKFQFPDPPLTPDEQEKIYAGKPIIRMFDTPDGLKNGYLRFFAPFDPVTSWMVVTDIEHAGQVDPAFPATGNLTEKKRTMLPYLFENAVCAEQNETHVYQLLVMPLVAPRRVCVKENFDTSAFPWEYYWDKTSSDDCCMGQRNPDMKRFWDDAVFLVKNRGGWRINPLPKEFRRTPQDVMRTEMRYFLDMNPGGNLEKLKPIVNRATKIGSEALMENVVFQGKRWEQFLSDYHDAATVAKYHQLVEAYRAAMTQ